MQRRTKFTTSGSTHGAVPVMRPLSKPFESIRMVTGRPRTPDLRAIFDFLSISTSKFSKPCFLRKRIIPQSQTYAEPCLIIQLSYSPELFLQFVFYHPETHI